MAIYSIKVGGFWFNTFSDFGVINTTYKTRWITANKDLALDILARIDSEEAVLIEDMEPLKPIYAIRKEDTGEWWSGEEVWSERIWVKIGTGPIWVTDNLSEAEKVIDELIEDALWGYIAILNEE